MSIDKKLWKYNSIVRDLATRKYHQRIKRQKSPYADDNYDIHIELLDLDNPESTLLEKNTTAKKGD